jgi:NAD(P)-dependent dehydrogenase (short-subunit alcohol dehydrogenase family)
MSAWKQGAPQVAFVSGGGSGIGLCVAKELIGEGSSVAIFDLKVGDDVLNALRQRCVEGKQNVNAYLVDITDPVAVESAMDQAAAEMGAPDLGFNSAGILRTGVFTDMPFETYELVVRINLIGSRNFAAGVLKHMGSGGHLVLVASMAGIVGSYTHAAYSSSKFGVIGLAEVLRLEQKLQGIDVSVICPGEIETPLLVYEREHGSPITKSLNEIAGVITVEQAVSGIMRGLKRRQYMITPGFRARVLRFIARKMPGLFHRSVDSALAKAYAAEEARK